MGMDVYGEKEDQYFQSSVWNWRPLWEYVCTFCINEEGDPIITPDENHQGGFNDGLFIEEKRAQQIGITLNVLIISGHALQTEDTWEDKVYNFNAEKIKNFASFATKSGGFRIY